MGQWKGNNAHHRFKTRLSGLHFYFSAVRSVVRLFVRLFDWSVLWSTGYFTFLSHRKYTYSSYIGNSQIWSVCPVENANTIHAKLTANYYK